MVLAAGDVNGDGRADLALATSEGVDVFLQGTGGLGLPQLSGPPAARQVEVADLTGDRAADLVVATLSQTVVLPGRGDGTFGEPVVAVDAGWQEIEVGNVTGDGRSDIVGTRSREIFVVPQRGDGTLGEQVSYHGGTSWSGNAIAVGDLTGDGRNDVAFSMGGHRPTSEVGVFPHTAEGKLSRPVRYPADDHPNQSRRAT
jgi:hypothetical protein